VSECVQYVYTVSVQCHLTTNQRHTQVCTVHSLYTHCTYTYCTLTVHSLSTHCTLTVHTLTVRELAGSFSYHGFQYVIVEAGAGVNFQPASGSLSARWIVSDLEESATIR
jgi:hypothetical protein